MRATGGVSQSGEVGLGFLAEEPFLARVGRLKRYLSRLGGAMKGVQRIATRRRGQIS